MADEPTGRSEIGRLSHHLQQMQHALQQNGASGAWRKFYRGTSEITAGNTDLSSRINSRLPPLNRPRPYGTVDGNR